jgi:hypothetical protein
VSLTIRQRKVAAMALAMVDVDTLNDNLRSVEQDETTGVEVDEIAALLADDETEPCADCGVLIAWDEAAQTYRHPAPFSCHLATSSGWLPT